MIGDDLIRRLSLSNQRRYDLILGKKFTFAHVETGTRIRQGGAICPIGILGEIVVFVSNGAFMLWFVAAITDIGCFIKPLTLLLFKVFTGLVTCGAGCAFNTTNNNLAAGICLPAVITMNAEVLSIVEAASVKPIRPTPIPYFFGDR